MLWLSLFSGGSASDGVVSQYVLSIELLDAQSNGVVDGLVSNALSIPTARYSKMVSVGLGIGILFLNAVLGSKGGW